MSISFNGKFFWSKRVTVGFLWILIMLAVWLPSQKLSAATVDKIRFPYSPIA